MRLLTPELIASIAATCNKPTGDHVLDGLFADYASNGFSTASDRPVYYRSLYRLAQRLPGLTMIELGARRGAASLHFLKGGGSGAVGVDVCNVYDPAHFFGLDYRTFDCGSCSSVLDGLAADVVMIDTDHTYETTKREYELWRPRVLPGGLMLFDDICAPEYGCTRFWNDLEGEKLTLPVLHPPRWGFGVLFC